MRSWSMGWSLVLLTAGAWACQRDEVPDLTPAGARPDDDDDDDDDDTNDTDDSGISWPIHTADSGDHTTQVGPDWADCTVASDNALRVVCGISDPERTGSAAWTVTQGDRVRTATADAGEEVVLWGFGPNQQVTWLVDLEGELGTGSFPTGTLPQGIASLKATVELGEAIETEAFAVPYTCDGQSGAAVFDATGTVVWYQQETSGGVGILAGVNGMDWDDGPLVSIDGDTLVEHDLLGNERFRLTGLDRPMHHDTASGPTYRYVLNAALHETTVVDGFYVVDRDGTVVAEWDLADHMAYGTTGIGGFWLSEFPFAADWSHANSIEPDGPDHVLISLKHLNAILRVVANPTLGDFGEIEWILDGGRAQLPSDFEWTDEGIFLDQHHVGRRANGGLTVFDNTSKGTSRALALTIDEAAGTVSEAQAWHSDFRCNIQGSFYEHPGGHVLSMCQSQGQVLEFPPDSSEPNWDVRLLCIQRSTGSGHLARAIPVSLPE